MIEAYAYLLFAYMRNQLKFRHFNKRTLARLSIMFIDDYDYYNSNILEAWPRGHFVDDS